MLVHHRCYCQYRLAVEILARTPVSGSAPLADPTVPWKHSGLSHATFFYSIRRRVLAGLGLIFWAQGQYIKKRVLTLFTSTPFSRNCKYGDTRHSLSFTYTETWLEIMYCLTTLAASLALSTLTSAIQVTSPGTSTLWSSGTSAQTISWQSVSTDPTSFSIELVNQVYIIAKHPETWLFTWFIGWLSKQFTSDACSKPNNGIIRHDQLGYRHLSFRYLANRNSLPN